MLFYRKPVAGRINPVLNQSKKDLRALGGAAWLTTNFKP